MVMILASLKRTYPERARNIAVSLALLLVCSTAPRRILNKCSYSSIVAPINEEAYGDPCKKKKRREIYAALRVLAIVVAVGFS